jgi:hypothetical protein
VSLLNLLTPRIDVHQYHNSVEVTIFGNDGGIVKFDLSKANDNAIRDIAEDIENAKYLLNVFVYQSSDPAPLRELIIRCKTVWPLESNIEYLQLPSTKDLRYFLGRLSVVIDIMENKRAQTRSLERIVSARSLAYRTTKNGLILAAMVWLLISLSMWG